MARVRLKHDLTQYDRRLLKGEEGTTTTVGQGAHARNYDRFVTVNFDCGAHLDILWQSLDRIDTPETAS